MRDVVDFKLRLCAHFDKVGEVGDVCRWRGHHRRFARRHIGAGQLKRKLFVLERGKMSSRF